MGVAAGYFSANHRSQRDIQLIQTQIDTHLSLALRQHEMQIEASQQAELRKRQADAYDKLGIWLHNLERTIDEIFFGYIGQDESARHRARQLLASWHPDILRVPLEASSAEFYWSAAVRKAIRQFEGESFNFITHSSAGISRTEKVEYSDRLQRYESAIHESRDDLLGALDRIRDLVRIDFGLQADR